MNFLSNLVHAKPTAHPGDSTRSQTSANFLFTVDAREMPTDLRLSRTVTLDAIKVVSKAKRHSKVVIA